MMSSPQQKLDAVAGEMTDGCPVVQLHDSPKEMTYHLKAVFDSGFYEPPGTHTDFATVAGVLRLSTKYDVPYLRRRSLAHLSTAYPTTLPAWALRETLRTIPPLDNTLIAVFALAREFDLPWILPAVLYCICTHPLDYTLNDVPLDAQDMKQCVRARAALTLYQNKCAAGFLRTGAPSCASVEECGAVRVRCVELVAGWEGVEFLDLAQPWIQAAMCAPCYAGFSAGYEASKESMWEELPGMAGLPRWEELEKSRRAALQL